MITNPWTGEVLDTSGEPKEWVQTALEWLLKQEDSRIMDVELRSALSRLTPNEKRTERWAGDGSAFKVERRPRPVRKSELPALLELQHQLALPEDLCPVSVRDEYVFNKTVANKIKGGAGETLEAMNAAIEKALAPEPSPRIVVEGLPDMPEVA